MSFKSLSHFEVDLGLVVNGADRFCFVASYGVPCDRCGTLLLKTCLSAVTIRVLRSNSPWTLALFQLCGRSQLQLQCLKGPVPQLMIFIRSSHLNCYEMFWKMCCCCSWRYRAKVGCVLVQFSSVLLFVSSGQFVCCRTTPTTTTIQTDRDSFCTRSIINNNKA
jgi:hypothetical protein